MKTEKTDTMTVEKHAILLVHYKITTQNITEVYVAINTVFL